MEGNAEEDLVVQKNDTVYIYFMMAIFLQARWDGRYPLWHGHTLWLLLAI